MRSLMILLILVPLLASFAGETIRFPAGDGVTITADLYAAHPDSAPFIILFHRAGWSRGEYLEIAPRLNELGFNCLAVDQRSGSVVNQVTNETARAAAKAGRSATYLDALQDMEAATTYVREHLARGKLLLWGSSYSAALVLKIAGDHPGRADGVLAFSPGEYFTSLGQSGHFIQDAAGKIEVPVFITSAEAEYNSWSAIYDAISAPKSFFLPEAGGAHGSETLWKSTRESGQYWKATEKFLKQFGGQGK